MDVEWERLELTDDRNLISAPSVETAWQCGSIIVVRGYIAGAALDVEIDGSVIVADFPGGFPNPNGAIVPLPGPLVAGQQVRALQKAAGATSDWSAPVTVLDHRTVYPNGLPRPEIDPVPLYRCGRRTGVKNLLPGCDVWIVADEQEVGRLSGAGAHQGVNVDPAYGEGQSVVAYASLCGVQSQPSEARITQPPPSPLPTPAPEPVYPGSQQLVVNNVVNGGQIDVSRNEIIEISTLSFGVRHTMTLATPLDATDRLTIEQHLCPGDPPSARITIRVSDCSKLPAPSASPVKAGDTSVTLTSFVSDARIKVFVNGAKTGDGSGPVVQLTEPVPGGATVHIHQSTPTCESSKALQIVARCLAPQPGGDPTAHNMYPVGFRTYDSGDFSLPGGQRVGGTIYYPAERDGELQPFISWLPGLTLVPIVFMAHGNSNASLDSHLGFEYLQRQLAAMGIVAVSVDCRSTNGHGGGPSNIVDRADLIEASIRFMKGNGGGPIWGPASPVDFAKIGLMGHSRGGEAVLIVAERLGQSVFDLGVRAVLSLAPTNLKTSSGRPKGFAFMTIVPAGDGDLIKNEGLELYDAAQPAPFKSQLYVDNANHNYFNRAWPDDDTQGGLPILPRSDHERILSAYGCAFFRAALRGEDMRGYLDGSLQPEGVRANRIHFSFALAGQQTVDDHEQGNGIGVNSMNRPNTPYDGLVADEYSFAEGGTPNFNFSFFGNTIGMVAQSEREGRFKYELDRPRDLGESEVWIRAAEVHDMLAPPPGPTGFALGLEDVNGVMAWVDCDGVGGLPRPFDRREYDLKYEEFGPYTKTVLTTLRFPAGCFAAQGRQRDFDIGQVTAIWLRLDREDGRALAFDDLQIVQR